MTKESTYGGRLQAVEALVALSAMDLLYSDRYLGRAEALFSSVCSRPEYEHLRRDEENLPQLEQQLRYAREDDLLRIPFDAYLRLAPKYGWGRAERWTHFDGYQVTRKLQLWALVGGNARFGGAEDLSSLNRDYESDHLTARFAVVRRERFLIRDARQD